MTEVSLPERLRHDLIEAMKAGDRPAVAALRQALGAIGNAEAPPVPLLRSVPTEPEVGRLVEHEPVALSAADVERILRAEIAERDTAAAEYLRVGRPDEAAAVTAEATVLRSYLT
jgi:uncharacterized protein YqeY